MTEYVNKSESLPFRPLSVKIQAMEKDEVKRIGDYIKDLEEGLYEWDYDQIAMQAEMPHLYQVIKQLMDATFEAKDQDLKILLASLEYKARRCKESIEGRLIVRN